MPALNTITCALNTLAHPLNSLPSSPCPGTPVAPTGRRILAPGATGRIGGSGRTGTLRSPKKTGIIGNEG